MLSGTFELMNEYRQRKRFMLHINGNASNLGSRFLKQQDVREAYACFFPERE